MTSHLKPFDETIQLRDHNNVLCRINKSYPYLLSNTLSYLELRAGKHDTEFAALRSNIIKICTVCQLSYLMLHVPISIKFIKIGAMKITALKWTVFNSVMHLTYLFGYKTGFPLSRMTTNN